tara:strand:+ start:988 stop:2178 length:1191 start_codon:yes stop_codon:yes gene_type:complete
MFQLARAGLIAVFILLAPLVAEAQSADEARFDIFNPSAGDHGRQQIDYSVWSDMLSDIVLNVGLSDRRSARGDPIFTGTRIYTGNDSRYRYENNRIILHLFEDFHTDAISAYRAELEELPDQLNFSALHPNEQLAYWLNLYTATIVEQVALNYPRHELDRMNAHGTNERLYEANILTVMGEPLSLNDIQFNIVYRFWDDPLVIYGFFNGSVGSPRIRRDAYEGDTVWRQLESNGREFVNALRGVDSTPNRLDISEHYRMARPYFFPDWENQVRAHLLSLANDDVAELVERDMPLRANVNEWGLADMTNGSSRCGGAISQTTTTADGTQRDASFCSNLPDNARILLNFVIERRLRQMRNGLSGDVFIRDLPDRSEQIVINLDEDEEEDTEAAEDTAN